MADAGYRFAPIFLIRMAGVPFDALEAVATTDTAEAARHLIARRLEFAETKSAAEKFLGALKHDLSKEQYQLLRKAIRAGVPPPVTELPSESFAACWESGAMVAEAESRLAQTLGRELDQARQCLRRAAQKYLPGYFVFAAKNVRELMKELLAERSQPNECALPTRNTGIRARERRLLLFLQRIAGKNDTFSEFGPEGWGIADANIAGIELNPEPGIARRETFLERWTAHGVAAAINADPEARPELSPRLHPDGRVQGDRFVFTQTGETIPLDRETLTLLQKCDGATPAYSLGVEPQRLAELAQRNLIRWELEVPALDPHALATLVAEIARWRDRPPRARWLERLQPIAALPAKFAVTTDTRERVALIDEANDRLGALGAEKASSRFLYAATNPIGEECFREAHFSINDKLLDEVATEAAPWIELWRDNYAFVASRVAAGLRGLLEKAPLQNGALPLPAFLRHCAEAKLSLTGPGLVAFAATAFREVKEAFAETFAERAATVECAVTTQDCQFVRRNFQFERFGEYTYPSADLQLSAASLEAVTRGDYQWVLAELHPTAALLHHGFYWSCPDKSALSKVIERVLCDKPNLHFGYFAADFAATTTVRLDALPSLTKFVAPERSTGNWQYFSPAEIEVFIDDQTGDVGVRTGGSHQYLGSFARGWIIALGFHPFSFSLGRHTPRLLCGNVVVQRRSWTVALAELGRGDFSGVSRELVQAVERLRTARDLPRHIYIRPTEQALRRSGAEGRDKDTKPVYVDLESYLFLEIFHRWLSKAGELEVTEMLPDPEHLLWQEADGRRTFELRTQILPR